MVLLEYLDQITAVVEEEIVEPSGEVEEVVVAAVEEEVVVEAEAAAEVVVEAEAGAVVEGVDPKSIQILL